jgi:hypothetical protein
MKRAKKGKAKSRRAKPGANWAPVAGMHYLPGGRAPREIPAGKVLVHNHITASMTPTKLIGHDGFRAWYLTAHQIKCLSRVIAVANQSLGSTTGYDGNSCKVRGSDGAITHLVSFHETRIPRELHTIPRRFIRPCCVH